MARQPQKAEIQGGACPRRGGGVIPAPMPAVPALCIRGAISPTPQPLGRALGAELHAISQQPGPSPAGRLETWGRSESSEEKLQFGDSPGTRPQRATIS